MADRPSPVRRGSSYLTPSLRDDDSGSVHFEADSDSDDDSVLRAARTSADIRAHDRNILFEEEERDRMLTEARQPGKERSVSGLGLSNPFKKLVGGRRRDYESVAHGSSEDLGQGSEDAARDKRLRRREEKRERLLRASDQGEDTGLLYEIEKGDMKEGGETGDSSDTEGLSSEEKAHLHDDEYTGRQSWGWRTWSYVSVLIALFITLLVLGAWRLSITSRRTKHAFAPVRSSLLSNGTALFKPTTLLISLDGFRADYLQRGVTPTLSEFMAKGVAPDFMSPAFPSLTFPNHYTIITGLYPESHGIVANKFWDPSLQKEFKYTDPTKSTAREWWSQAEPLWVTAEKAGIRTAIHMWPGSSASISDIEPAIVDHYKGKQPLDEKLSRVFDMLDMPGAEDETVALDEQRPQFIAAYVPNIDALGHKFGPNSTEVTDSLGKVDAMLGNLFAGIEARNLTNIVNIVIVSDHGMAETSNDRLIQMDKIIDMSLVEHVDGWPLYGIRPKEPVLANLRTLHKRLEAAAVEHGHVFDVYLKEGKGEDAMPEKWHFTENERIAPLWVVPKVGWAIVTKEEFDVEDARKTGLQYAPKGVHGYDHEDPDMRAIFAARGPAFNDFVGKHVEPFQNIEVYNMVCGSLYLTPRPNNGTFNFLHQAPALPAAPPTSRVPYPSGTTVVSSAMSSLSAALSSALSSASTKVAASISSRSASPFASSSTTGPENPFKKPAVTLSLDISSVSSAWEAASSAAIDRPVISEKPVAITPSTAASSPVTQSSTIALVLPTPIAQIPPPPPPADGEKEESSGGWWDFVKSTLGDAKDWVVGLLPGGATPDDDAEKVESREDDIDMS